jgi:MioC protein
MANILIIAGSVYGGAQYVAEQVQELLEGKGHQVSLTESPSIDDVKSASNDTLLMITSTTGQGDLPDNLVSFHSDLKSQFPLLPHKRYGVIALGDSSYGETYCGGGKQLDEIFAELQTVKLGEMLQVDACETLQPEDAALPWAEEWAGLL